MSGICGNVWEAGSEVWEDEPFGAPSWRAESDLATAAWPGAPVSASFETLDYWTFLKDMVLVPGRVI